MIDDIVKHYMAPVMKADGFKKRRALWNRRQDAIVHVLQLQKSRWNDKESGSFTLNIGIWVQPVWQILWDKKAPSMIGEADCFPRYRVGELVRDSGPATDLWWSVDPSSSLDAIGHEVQMQLQETCLPFLAKYTSLATILEAAESERRWRHPVGRLEFAILNYLNDRPDVAQSIIESMESDNRLTMWHGTIQQVRERLAATPG